MKPVEPYRTNNRKNLKTVSNNFPSVEALKTEISESYNCYLVGKGNPTNVTQLDATEAQLKLIKEDLYDCYKSARVRDDLAWISKYRDQRGRSHCPMCGSAHPKSLDHYLPREHYPEFSVFSYNLVPSCIMCNQHRSSSANKPGTALPMIHPFFEWEIISAPFLYAHNEGTYLAPKFIPRVEHGDATIKARLEEHVKRSIDLPAFQDWLDSGWSKLQGLATRHRSIPSLDAEIRHQLHDEVRLVGSNTWDAAFLRGILKDGAAIEWLVENPV